MMIDLKQGFDRQEFQNGYELINGTDMHAENPEHFLIPPDVIKRHIGTGHFVELRIDSPRFSVHQQDAQECLCPSCNGAMAKPILRHEQPATLLRLPDQRVPSRGWGEDFWVHVTSRSGDHFGGVVDNPLVESRLHGVNLGDELFFSQDQVLAVHPIHRIELVSGMAARDLKELADWLGKSPR